MYSLIKLPARLHNGFYIIHILLYNNKVIFVLYICIIEQKLKSTATLN